MELRIKNLKLIIVFILLLSFLIRIAYILTLDNTLLTGPDAGMYDKLAANFLSGKGLILNDGRCSFRPCLFPLFLAGVYSLFGHSYLAAKIILAVISSFTCLLIYWLGKESFNKSTGLIAMGISAIYPKFVYYSAQLCTETLYMFFLVLSFLFLIKYRHSLFFFHIMLAGMFFALASLTRSILFAFFPLVLIWLVIGMKSKKKAFMHFLVFAFTILLTMSPWIGRNYRLHHAFVPTTTEGGYSFWIGSNPLATGGGHCYSSDSTAFDKLSEVDRDRLYYKMGFDYIKKNPSKFIQLAFNKFLRFWRIYPHQRDEIKKGVIVDLRIDLKYVIIGGISFGVILPFFIFGLIVSMFMWRKVLLFHLLIVYYTLIHMMFFAVTRSRAVIMPFIIIIASYGVLVLLCGFSNNHLSEGI
ncbi:glycosyltransferase family 39 protein [bacterium]|nr:glycosyltransferase family 39 protein [bacterium]